MTSSTPQEMKLIATIRVDAQDSWLEPYIGHEFEVRYRGTYQSQILIDYGDRREPRWAMNYMLDIKQAEL